MGGNGISLPLSFPTSTTFLLCWVTPFSLLEKKKKRNIKPFSPFEKLSTPGKSRLSKKETYFYLFRSLLPSFSHLRIIKKVQREKMEKEKKVPFSLQIGGESRSWSSFEHKGRRRGQKTNPWGISNEIRKKKRCLFVFPLSDGCGTSTLVFHLRKNRERRRWWRDVSLCATTLDEG